MDRRFFQGLGFIFYISAAIAVVEALIFSNNATLMALAITYLFIGGICHVEYLLIADFERRMDELDDLHGDLIDNLLRELGTYANRDDLGPLGQDDINVIEKWGKSYFTENGVDMSDCYAYSRIIKLKRSDDDISNISA